MAETAKFQQRYQLDITQAVGTSATQVIREGMSNFNDSLAFIIRPDPTGTGKIQVTYDQEAVIETGSPVFEDWPPGDVSIFTTNGILTYITGWRVVVSSGTVIAQVRGSF